MKRKDVPRLKIITTHEEFSPFVSQTGPQPSGSNGGVPGEMAGRRYV